jgi:hypothetical protein
MEIIKSASKIVFVIITITVCAGFLLKVLDSKDFMILASMVFSFYFSNKGDGGNVGTSYLGK